MQVGTDELAVLGRRVRRIDGVEKATGQARYTADLRLPRLLHGKVVRSSVPHARIRAIDLGHARKVPGVKAILTGLDLPDHRFGLMVQDQRPLARDKVRFIGDEVAAVVASHADAAAEAADLVRIEYDELPAVYDVFEAMQPEAPRLHEVEGNVAYRLAFQRGNVDEALAASDVVVSARYRTSAVHPLPLEPMVCVAEPHADGRLTIYTPNQNIFLARGHLAKALRLPLDRLRLVQLAIGGGFGAKLDMPVHVQAAVMALAVRQPVRLLLDRHEDFSCTMARVPMTVDLTLGARRDGTLTAKRQRIIADNGAYSSHAPAILASSSTKGDSLYRVRNVACEGLLVYTNKTPTGAFRGYGNPQLTFALESHMDVLAEALGIDPVELRLKNAMRPGEVSVHGNTIHSGGAEVCLRRALQVLPPLPEVRAPRGPGGRLTRRGRGVACGIHVSGARGFVNWDGGAAQIHLHEDGTARLLNGDGEMGQGSMTTLAQIVAEELGLKTEDVRVAPPDTDTSPYGLGSFASRLTVTTGHAVRNAAREVRRQLCDVAADALEVSADDLEFVDRRIRLRGSPQHGMSVADAAARAVFRQGGAPIMGQGVYDAPTTLADPVTKYGDTSSTYVFMCQVADVEVDLETGRVTVLNLYSAHDIGKVMNPLGAEGQVEGGVAQGLGFALSEEVITQGGKIQNADLTDYRLLTALDLPAIAYDLLETNDPIGPYGAKALGETPLVPTAAAVANAVRAATGVRISELPLSPARVLAALRAAKRG
ncbi:MAG: molybdopterin-dependent oxidoreductase [Candidatus Tectomicrobia bacterium]|nr:molybdopterin-dependent oxidoreductase [Candidatus Tectomicrobia bacterium]